MLAHRFIEGLRLLLMAVLVAAVGVVVTTTSETASAQESLLEVEITGPADSSEIDVCQNYEVKATITNNGTVTATDVTANISYGATAVEWVAGDGSSYPHTQSLGDIDPGCAVEVAWTLRCRNAGVTPITVTADADNAEPASDQISVSQMIKVEIIQPDPDCAAFEACPGQTFTAKAEVTNTGDISLTLNETGVAIVDGPNFTAGAPSPSPANAIFQPDQSTTYTWTLHCDALGDDIIRVEVYNDQDVLIGYDEYAFHQRGLTVDIVMPESDEVFCASNDFYVNAVMTNTCNDTIYDVNATISGVDPYNVGSEFNAELENANETFLKQIGDIPGKLSKDLMWKLHCKGVGPVTITVDVDGETAFGEEVSHSDSVTVYQDTVLAIEINSPVGAEIYCASQHFDLTFTIHNRGEVVALDVAATIDPGATAEVDGEGQGVSWTTPILGDILGGQTIGPFTYDMHCTGTGDSTITVDATAGNLIDEQTGGDSVTVTQAAEEVTLKVEIVNPMTSDEFCTHCYNEFTVDAIISNPACAVVENAFAQIHYSCGPGDVSILSPWTQLLGDIGSLTSTTGSWDVACTGGGDVTFWVEAWADNVDPVGSWNNVTIHQKDFIVEITDVGGIDSAPLTLPTCQEFTITARFINCHETTQLVNIQPILDFSDVGAVPVAGSMVHIKYCYAGCNQTVCEETGEENIPVEDTLLDVPPFRSRAVLNRICPCCCAEVTWTLECVSAISGEFTVAALTSGGIFLDEDSASINQQWKSHLVAGMEVFPGTVSEPIAEDTFITTSADAIGVCQDFSVVAMVTNIGEATAANVEVTIDVTGNASPSGTLTQTVDANIPGVAPGTIPGGQSGKAMWELHCDGLGEVWIEIIELTGVDANTSNPILLENIEIPMARSVSQVLAVEIVQPVTSTQITACSEFTVGALVTYIGDIDLVDVVASITLTDYPEGTEPATRAELIDSSTKGLGTIPTGVTRDVEWLGHCLSGGDVAIRVTARSGGLYAVSAPVIVHQVAAEIGVGGEVYPTNKVAILAPWIALAVAIIAGGTILVRRRRAHHYID